MVNWVLKNDYAFTRVEAVAKLSELFRAGLLYHVVHEHEFEDADFFYRWVVQIFGFCGRSCGVYLLIGE